MMTTRLFVSPAARRAPVLLAVLAAAIAAQPARAQATHSHDDTAGMPGMQHAAELSPLARRQVDSVTAAIARLGSPEAATAAGFHPFFGWIPTMGVHWVDMTRMRKATQADRAAPAQLMFSRIAGRDSLVGAAYGYFAPVGDTTPPTLFDGAPMWHEHPDLAPPGRTLRMLHVWFVPSPDGPFAGTNPNLPFWAVGLSAPDSARMHDQAWASMVRHAALALAEVADSASIFRQVWRQPAVQPLLAARRDSVAALIPELRAAEQAHDAARWDRAANHVAAQWDGMYATYLASARTDAARARMERYVAMLLGQHGE